MVVVNGLGWSAFSREVLWGGLWLGREEAGAVPRLGPRDATALD